MQQLQLDLLIATGLAEGKRTGSNRDHGRCDRALAEPDPGFEAAHAENFNRNPFKPSATGWFS